MKIFFTVTILTALATPASADERALLTQYEQQLSDAITNGTPAVWDKYLDPEVIFAEEDDSYKSKKEMIKEVRPLPKGLGGEIKVELLSYYEAGDTRGCALSPARDRALLRADHPCELSN